MMVVALGVAWILDGLEITIASNVTGLISSKQALNLSSAGGKSLEEIARPLSEVPGASDGPSRPDPSLSPGERSAA
jgi:hypothetical protein